MSSLKFISKNKQAKTLLYIAIINVLIVGFLLLICHTSGSLALTAFTYLLIFDFLSIVSGLLSIWIKYQVSNAAYPYGFKRCEVLAIFSTSILTILGAFFIIKESAESLFEEKEVHTGRLLPAYALGFAFHMLIVLGVRNESFDYVVKSSSSSWLQEHIFDLSENTCRFVPGLSRLLLPRANPFVLIGVAHAATLAGSYALLQLGSGYLVDTYAAALMAVMTIGTMLPFAVYTGKILLQTTPAHLIAQLDKSLREASTLDGVLEFRDEHFWTLSFGVLAGSLHVRIRRDADEQLVLAHVWNKLAGLVQILTIHIFKDDWMRRTTHQLVYSHQQQQQQQQHQHQHQHQQQQYNLSHAAHLSATASLSALNSAAATAAQQKQLQQQQQQQQQQAALRSVSMASMTAASVASGPSSSSNAAGNVAATSSFQPSAANGGGGVLDSDYVLVNA